MHRHLMLVVAACAAAGVVRVAAQEQGPAQAPQSANLPYTVHYDGRITVRADRTANDATTVLVNKYGDCKDMVTLMSALLSAKGIASEPALLNLGNAYTLPEPPTLVALNHVILYLPEFGIYDRFTPYRRYLSIRNFAVAAVCDPGEVKTSTFCFRKQRS